MGQAVRKTETQEIAEPVSGLPATMIERAIASGASVEVMEKLLDMHARWEAMQARKAFDNAMAQLRENMPTVVKNQNVDFTTQKGRTNYKYEDLSDVTEALSPVMSGLGLSFRWRTDNSSGGVKVTCVITHRDGHSEETSLVAPVDQSGNKNAIQAIGSAVTYLQRYTLKAAVGIAASNDDDGRSAGARPDEQQSPNKPEAQPKADSRETYTRLSKANREIKSVEDFDKFWADQRVRDAANTLPADWKRSLGTEKTEKLADLRKPAPQDDDAFPGDLPMPEHA